MLYWGQQGVTPDIQTAARHYERGAVQWEDPVLMYDYGIVLMHVRTTAHIHKKHDNPLKDNLV